MTDPKTRYRQSDKGRAAERKYATSPQGTQARRAAQAKYRQSPKGIEARKRAQAAYRARKKVATVCNNRVTTRNRATRLSTAVQPQGRVMMQAIQTKYLGATNYRPSRIKAWCDAGSVVITYPHEMHDDDANQHAAEALQHKLGWDTAQYGHLHGGALPGNAGYAFVFVKGA